jgi:hypothetical protein
MPARRKPKPAACPKEVARKPRKPQARKSTDRPLRRAASSTPGLLPELERRAPQRDRCAVLPLPSQGEPVKPLVMWKVYKHPKDYPGEYVARKFLITEALYEPSNESISSRWL